MTEIRRLTDSCLVVTSDDDITMFDPGFHTFQSGEVDLDSIGDITRIVISHEHADHVNPDFIKWVNDRNQDLTIWANPAVAAILDKSDVAVDTGIPEGMTVEDVLHERLPTGAQPPNRVFTLNGLFTHPGDSHQLASSARILALPLLAPWTSITSAVEFARRMAPQQVIPVHDFYLSADGREFVSRLCGLGLGDSGVEVVPLGWGESCTV